MSNHRTESSPPPAVAFTVKLARALHRLGAPSHRLEDAMTDVSRALGIQGAFFATPTAVFATFDAPGYRETFLVRAEQGEVDLERQTLVEQAIDDVSAARISPTRAEERVDEILAAPARYGPATRAACFAVASGSAASFLGGGWREMALTSVVGLVIGLMAILARRFRNAGRLFEPAAAALAAAVAVAAATTIPHVSLHVTLLAGVIVLIPGFTLTVAMTELSSGHLVSGSSRLTGAVVMFMGLAFGAVLGSRVAGIFFGAPAPVDPVAPPGWILWAALGVAPFAHGVLLGARPRDMGWILCAGVLAFFGARLGAHVLGPELGALVGALLVGMGSNALARVRRHPAGVTLVPGLMLLVPGSLGFRSFSALAAHDVLSGLQAAFTMAFVAVALVAGLLAANLLVPPRRAL
ncbi:MAG: threonine/serine exporter family protein [Candidatus Eisenbacteria bacterium]|nr:threonine/serine exporter family protein [Candidatus Eisenbacteria bacterium]